MLDSNRRPLSNLGGTYLYTSVLTVVGVDYYIQVGAPTCETVLLLWSSIMVGGSYR